MSKESSSFCSEARAEGFAAGLVEAKRRLSLGGLHEMACPEPAQPCICGLDEAIDTEFAPGAVAAWSQPSYGSH